MPTVGEQESAWVELRPGGVLLEKYRFEHLLGEGGQGEVWKAHNLALDLPVAIKILRGEPDDDFLVERLFREARAAASLGHPAIVRVFDVGHAPNGAPFLVMELLAGQDLSERLAQAKRLPPELTVRLLLPIADALLTAHRRGIVHRDVKPENVFIAVSGDTVQPKLLDFGVAKVPKDPRITQTGAIIGSPAYLSPEQARAEAGIDARSDIWAFSATLYQCLTGELPFDGPSWRLIRAKILENEPRALLDYGIEDAKLWQLLRRGLAKSKEERWPDMLALGRALAGWLIERGVTVDVCGSSLESRWLSSEPLAIELSSSSAPETPAKDTPPRTRETAAPNSLTPPVAQPVVPARFPVKSRWLAFAAAAGALAVLASLVKSEPPPRATPETHLLDAPARAAESGALAKPESLPAMAPTSAQARPDVAPLTSVRAPPEDAPPPSVRAQPDVVPSPKPATPRQPAPIPTARTKTPPLDLMDPYSDR